MPTERRLPVNVYMVRLYCECGGEMDTAEMVLPTLPPQYPHVCLSCGSRAIRGKIYPHLVYGEMEPT